jgi:hypothetical protein
VTTDPAEDFSLILLLRSVNITSLSVPDARLDLDSAEGPPLPDPRVIVTTYDLQWPNATETLNETAIRLDQRFGAGGQTSGNSSTYDPICMAVVESPMWPNVTNKLRDSNDGDCTAILGQDCVAALLSNPWTGGGCGAPDLIYSRAACQDVFNLDYQVLGACKSTARNKTRTYPSYSKKKRTTKLTVTKTNSNFNRLLRRRWPKPQQIHRGTNPRRRRHLVLKRQSKPRAQQHRSQASREPTPRHVPQPAQLPKPQSVLAWILRSTT